MQKCICNRFMKNLTPLHRKISYWDDIVNNMNLVNRTPLQGIRPSVLLRFNEYGRYANPNRLELIPASSYVAPHVARLKKCYGSGANPLNLLKQKIRDKQPNLLKGECQYCNMGEPSTIDHYLPQSYFPEFAALSVNLVPCCPTCNTEKGEEWLVLARRRIINYYFDQLPNIQYLFCTITIRHGVAKGTFSLNTAAVPGVMGPVIKNHFDALGLLERYKSRSDGEIMEIYDAIRQRVGQKTAAEMRLELIADAIGVQALKGTNYWRTIIKIALANSSQFLVTAGF